MRWKDFVVPIAVALILGIGSVTASNDREIAGISQKLNAVHDDVKTIKTILLEKGLE
jgi:hypothetical protein